MEKETLLILDGNSILHRAFHALPPLSSKKGQPTNAIYGFLLVFLKVIKKFQPHYVLSCFDYPAKTFRHYKFRDYKAKRPPTPENLVVQLKKIKEILHAFDVETFEKEGFEADDLIGSIIEKSPAFLEKIIISGDSDLLQLLKENVKVYLLKKGVKNTVLYDEKKFIENFILKPNQLVDFKALVGDSSDNISGIKGVGKKTALELLKKYESLENLYKKIKKKEPLNNDIINKLINNENKVFFNKEILTINSNALSEVLLKRWQLNKEKTFKILEEYEFKSLFKGLLALKNGKGIQGKLI